MRYSPKAAWDRLVGPDATPAENIGTVSFAVAGALATAVTSPHEVHRRHRLTTAMLAADLWGGAWCNNTQSALLWYGRPDRRRSMDLIFPIVHLHPFVFAAMGRSSVRRAAMEYVSMLCAVAIVRSSPQRIRRPVAAALTAAVSAASLHKGLASSNFPGWARAAYWMKLVMGHATA